MVHTHPKPTVLYKYRAAENFSRDVELLLRRRQLWLAGPASLNDPFDCNPACPPREYGTGKSSTPANDQLMLLSRAIAQTFAVIAIGAGTPLSAEDLEDLTDGDRRRVRALQKDISETGICALSAPRDHPVLWAHYGGNSRGFAVGYRISSRELEWQAHLRRVTYSRSRPLLARTREISYEEIACTKGHHWQYEEEWRLLRAGPGGIGAIAVPSNAIAEICIGPLASQEHRKELVAAARALPDSPRMLQGRLHDTDYSITFEDITA